MVEDLAPGRVLRRAAPMAFVDDDQVEEIRGELLIELLSLFRAGDRLVEAEIDLVGGVDPPLGADGGDEVHRGAVVALDGLRFRGQLGHRRTERPEVVDHRLVDQDVPVGQEQDAFLALGLP